MAAKVRRDEKGIYWVVVHFDGKRRKKRIGKSRRAAERVAEEIQARLKLGQYPGGDEAEEAIPFNRFAEKWLRREVEIPIEQGSRIHFILLQNLTNGAHVLVEPFRHFVDVGWTVLVVGSDTQVIGAKQLERIDAKSVGF